MIQRQEQVISLEIAEKLKELGVKQESTWYYSKPYDIHVYHVFKEIQKGSKFPPIAAFNVAELGELLPRQTYSQKRDEEIQPLWRCELSPSQFVRELPDGHTEYGKTEADARGNMLVYLIEKKLISITK